MSSPVSATHAPSAAASSSAAVPHGVGDAASHWGDETKEGGVTGDWGDDGKRSVEFKYPAGGRGVAGADAGGREWRPGVAMRRSALCHRVSLCLGALTVVAALLAALKFSNVLGKISGHIAHKDGLAWGLTGLTVALGVGTAVLRNRHSHYDRLAFGPFSHSSLDYRNLD